MTNRAALYLRSSKDRSDVSIDAQRRALHELAIARSLVVVDEFADAVESGKDEDRPAFQRLLHELKLPARVWEHVLCLDTSRVGRRRTIAMFFEQECHKRGVRVVYKNVPDTDPITEMLLKSILQAMDEWHSLTSRQKGLAGMAENVRQGWRAGGRAPRGYRLEQSPTGAIRDGEEVLKSKLVLDGETAGLVRAYLLLRAEGMPRGTVIARLDLPWPANSTHSMDWQALTYAGHTVWNVHTARSGGAAANGVKRRPRAEWMIQRNTHEALIKDAEAEAIMAQQERATQHRRLRESPLLLTGLLTAPDATAWHSDGCGSYRLGKGKKVMASRIEPAVLAALADELGSERTADRLHAALLVAAGAGPVDGRTIAGMERRAAALAAQVGKTVDLAAQMDDAAPALRRVKDLEQQRAGLMDEIHAQRARVAQSETAAMATPGEIRVALRRLLGDIAAAAADSERRAAGRQMLAEVLERIELDPVTLSCRMHYAVQTGDMVASPRPSDLSPATRWTQVVELLPKRQRAA